MGESERGICGESYDHDDKVVWDDDDVTQWECRHCGAEWWEDK